MYFVSYYIFIGYEGNSNIHFDFVSIFIELSSVFLIERTRQDSKDVILDDTCALYSLDSLVIF